MGKRRIRVKSKGLVLIKKRIHVIAQIKRLKAFFFLILNLKLIFA